MSVKDQAGACRRCFVVVAPYAPQVAAGGGIYHRECYEAWYVGVHGRPPRLVRAPAQPHRFAAVDAAA
jgi:hypothetical protein